jgi:hypothetical protein
VGSSRSRSQPYSPPRPVTGIAFYYYYCYYYYSSLLGQGRFFSFLTLGIFLEEKRGRQLRLTASPPSMCRLFKKCEDHRRLTILQAFTICYRDSVICLFFFFTCTRSVGLLGREINPSRPIPTHRIRNASSGIRVHDLII